MIITVINEPRAGSFSLVKWLVYRTDTFEYSKNFTLLRGRPRSKDNQRLPLNDKRIKLKLDYKTKYLVVSYVHFPGDDYDLIFKQSDKNIFLYRENEEEQAESLIAMMRTGVCNSFYKYKEMDDDFSMNQRLFLKELKADFAAKYLSNKDNFCISYEELFKGNGINRVVEYLNIPEIPDGTGFPYGKKYRQFGDFDIEKKHIV